MRSINNCKVCVVGGAGFLGSHLVDHLIDDRACDVLVVDNLVVGRREFVHKQAWFEHADITKSEAHLRALFAGCKYVFNYAAWPYVPDSYVNPLRVFEVNATGAIQVINAAQEAGVEATLQISSAELYGGVNDQQVVERGIGEFQIAKGRPIDENGIVSPHSTYGVAKAAVDSYVQCTWKERKTPCIALRQFNCIGSRETHPYVVPEIISQLAKQQVANYKTEQAQMIWRAGITKGVVKLGNNSFRDFLYAGDAVRIAVELLERGEYGEVYNLGSETGVKIYDLAKLIGKVMGFADVMVERDEARVRPWEIWHLQSDNSKVREALCDRMRAAMPLEEALKRTVVWYNENGRRWPWEKA